LSALRIALLASLIALGATAQNTIDYCIARCVNDTDGNCVQCCVEALSRSSAPACQSTCRTTADACFARVTKKFDAYLASCAGSFKCEDDAVAFQRSGNAQCHAIEVQCGNNCLIAADLGTACAPPLKSSERTDASAASPERVYRYVRVTNETTAAIGVTAVSPLACGGTRWVSIEPGQTLSFPTRPSCAFQYIGAATSPEDAAQVNDCTPPGDALIVIRRVNGKLSLDRTCGGA
jgi:hypothetical protein